MSTQFLAQDGIAAGSGLYNILSLYKDPYSCTLLLEAFKKLWLWKGPFDIDVFSSPVAVARDPSSVARLLCISPLQMKGRLHCEALSFVDSRMLYAFPPPGLIAKYLRFVCNNNLKCVLIVPNWPTAVWWPIVGVLDRLSLGLVKGVMISSVLSFIGNNCIISTD